MWIVACFSTALVLCVALIFVAASTDNVEAAGEWLRLGAKPEKVAPVVYERGVSGRLTSPATAPPRKSEPAL